MLNEALLRTPNDFNNFTTVLREYITHRSDHSVTCRLRNDTIVDVVYGSDKPSAEGQYFHSPDWKYCWNNNGESVTSDDYDLIELFQLLLFDPNSYIIVSLVK